MNQMTHDEMIAIIQAHKEGKVIQVRTPDERWITLDLEPTFNFAQFIYRIKPEPKEIWVLETKFAETIHSSRAAAESIRYKVTTNENNAKITHYREVIDSE